MHVLYFHQYFQTPKGISGTRSYSMAQALIKAGYSVTMVCSNLANGNTGLDKPFINNRRRGMVDNIDVIEFNLKYSNHLNYIKRTIVFIKYVLFSINVILREPFDIVFATSTPLTIGIPGIFARWFKRKKFIFEVRDLWPEMPRAMGVIKNPLILVPMTILEWLSYHSANRLIALSPGIKKGIIQRGINEEKIDVISNGFDFSVFSENFLPSKPDGVNEDDFLAIFAGAHGVANGLDSVLDAALILKKKKKKNIKIILIGDGKLKFRLKKRAKLQKLDNILFLDPVPKTQLINILKSADIGLQILDNIPSFYFGTSPNKFFDYLASGLPILNNYPGWLADLIKKYDCGYLVNPHNPEEFADKLIYASENSAEIKRMGFNSKKLAQKEFDMKLLGKKFVKCFEEVND